MSTPRPLRSVPPTTDKTAVNRFPRLRRVLQTTRTDYRRYGIPPVLALYAHPGGKTVLKEEATTLAARLRLLCGVQVATRWGTVQLQWRAFPRG